MLKKVQRIFEIYSIPVYVPILMLRTQLKLDHC